MSTSVRRLDLRPLDQQVLVIGKRHLAGGRLSGIDCFRHLAERTGRGAIRYLFMAGQIRNIAELVLGSLILKHDFMSERVNDGNDHRLRVEQHLGIILGPFWGERHRCVRWWRNNTGISISVRAVPVKNLSVLRMMIECALSVKALWRHCTPRMRWLLQGRPAACLKQYRIAP